MNMMMQIRNKTPHPAAITTAAYRTVLSPSEKEEKPKYDLMSVQMLHFLDAEIRKSLM